MCSDPLRDSRIILVKLGVLATEYASGSLALSNSALNFRPCSAFARSSWWRIVVGTGFLGLLCDRQVSALFLQLVHLLGHATVTSNHGVRVAAKPDGQCGALHSHSTELKHFRNVRLPMGPRRAIRMPTV